MQKIYCTILFITFCFKLVGQDNKYEIALEVAPCITHFRGTATIDPDNKLHVGFLGAINFQYNFNNTFSLRTNISYNKCSLETNDEFLIIDNFGNVKLMNKSNDKINIYTIPLLLRASLGSNLKFLIEAGPYLAFLKKNSTVSSTQNNYVTDIPSSKINFGLSAGIGTAIPISDKININVNIRNNLALNNLGLPIKTNSTGFIVGVSYKFGYND